jgi:hypothetical protein
LDGTGAVTAPPAIAVVDQLIRLETALRDTELEQLVVGSYTTIIPTPGSHRVDAGEIRSRAAGYR